MGRGHYPWIREQFEEPADLKIFVLHHHLIDPRHRPGAEHGGRRGRRAGGAGPRGRERRALRAQARALRLRLEDMYLTSAGTCSSLRVRGHTKPCYNVLEFDRGEVTIFRKFPFGEGSRWRRCRSPPAQMQREGEGLMQESAEFPTEPSSRSARQETSHANARPRGR